MVKARNSARSTRLASFTKSPNRNRALLASILAVPMLGLASHSAYAANDAYWDINGNIPGAGGATPTGAWDAVTPNWTLDPTGSSATQIWTANDNAFFSAGTDATGAYTVTVSGTQTVSALTFEEGNVTLATGTIALNPSSFTNPITFFPENSTTIDTLAGASATIAKLSNPVSGTITKTGAGTLAITSNTSPVSADPGQTQYDVEGGTLSLASGSIGTAPTVASTNYYIIANGATLQYATANVSTPNANRGIGIGTGGGTINVVAGGNFSAATIASVIGGGDTETLTKTGAGILTVIGGSSYGDTIINAGTFALGSSSALTAGAHVTVNSGAILDVQTYNVTNNPVVLLNDGSTLQGFSASGVGGGLTIAGGTGPIIADNATVNFKGETLNTFFNINSGPANATPNVDPSAQPTIHIQGPGVVRLVQSNANGADNSNFIGNWIIDPGAFLQFTSLSVSAIGSSTNVLTNNGGTIVLRGGFYPNAINANADTVILSDGSGTGAYNGHQLDAIGFGGTFTIGNNQLLLQPAQGIGSGSLTDIYLGASSTSDNIGGITLTGSPTFNVVSLSLGDITSKITFSPGVISGGYGFTRNGAGTLNLLGANTLTGPVVLNDGPTLMNTVDSSLRNISSLTLTGGSLDLSNVTANNSDRIGDSVPVALGGAELKLEGPSGAGPLTESTGPLTLNKGLSIISLTAGDNNTILNPQSLTRNPGSTLLVRGTSLGSAPGGGATNLTFATAPTLVGGNGAAGSTTLSILPGVIAETAVTGTGTTGNLVTYDPTNGVRPLTAAEYATTITDGATTSDNVAPAAAIPLTLNTQVNALKLSTAGNLSIGTGATLTLASGMIYNNLTAANVTGPGHVDTGTGELIIYNTGTMTFSAVIGGTNSLTKSGAGTLVLNGTNSFSGGVAIDQGSLNVTTFASLGTSTGPISLASGTATAILDYTTASATTLARNIVLGGNGTIQVNAAAGVVTHTGTISETGTSRGLTKTGSGTLILNSGNTFSGPTTITLGTLAITDDSALGIAPTRPVGGDIILTAGTLQFRNSMQLNSNRNIVLGAGAFDVATGATATFSGAIFGAAAKNLTKTGAGTLLLNNPNALSITPTASNGVNSNGEYDGQAIGSNFLGKFIVSGGLVQFAGGTSNLGVNPTAPTPDYYTLSNGGGISFAVGLTFTTSLFTNQSPLSVNRGFTLNAGGGIIDTTSAVSTAATSGTSVVIGGIIAGTGSLTKTGAGFLNLGTSTHTYTGGTVVNGGTLYITTDNLGTAGSNLGFSGNSTLQIANNAGLATSHPVAISGGNATFSLLNTTTGAGTISSFGNLALGANSLILQSNTTVNSGTFGLTFGDTTLTGNGTITTTNQGSATALVTLASLSDSGSGFGLTKTGNGKLLISGLTTIGGTLTDSTGTAELTGAASVGNLSGTGATAVLTDDTSITTTGGTTATMAGIINGAGSLTKGGTGTLVLTNAANAYAGGTTVNGGVLQSNVLGALPGTGATVVVNNGGTLAAGYAIDQAFLGRITSSSTGSAALALNSSNNLDLSSLSSVSLGAVGSRTYSGTLTPSGSTYRLGGGGGTLTLANTITDGKDLVVDSNGGSSASTVILTGTNKFGSLTIGAAKLDVGSNRLVLTNTPESTLRSQLFSGRNETAGVGLWNGTGLISSVAAADASKLTAIGYLTAGDLGVTTWGGVSGLSSSAVLTLVTTYGDINLDGKVNRDDIALLDRGFAKYSLGSITPNQAVWLNGDFNYDGTVSSADYLLLDKTLAVNGLLSPDILSSQEAQFGSAFVSQVVAAVPEPTSLLSLLAALPLFTRRRRNAC